MATILQLLSSSGKAAIQDDINGNHDVRYLTLGDTNPASGNRYYVSLTGPDAVIDWQVGDSVMVELGFFAYKNKGQWHVSHRSDAMNLIEINTIKENKTKRSEYY